VRTKSASSNAPSAIPDLVAQTSVSYQSTSDGRENSLRFRDVTSAALAGAVPWRKFRWVRGQKHYSGTYWSATDAPGRILVDAPVSAPPRLRSLDARRCIYGPR
jgi:hypothetical protein